ncbi:uncharacterized protein LOC133903121 [Phragmites australis]|uniref:uncharacterized protein LOC133903121 n=1 Tax=Phragmites australis TaxID=29695 RepID=UPI002D79014D|nr:uncharacterized protein LOC133903121 [Phragmites australis]
MASLLGLYGGGGRRKIHARSGSGAGAWRSVLENHSLSLFIALYLALVFAPFAPATASSSRRVMSSCHEKLLFRLDLPSLEQLFMCLQRPNGLLHCHRVDSAAPVRKLLRRLRSMLTNSAARPRRSAVRFGYDPQSYSQNFDDGLGSSGF